jgi:hypothetical protein
MKQAGLSKISYAVSPTAAPHAAAALIAPVTLGVAASLLIGKVVGVLEFAWLAVRLGLADMPAHASRLQMLGGRTALRDRVHHEHLHHPARFSEQSLASKMACWPDRSTRDCWAI